MGTISCASGSVALRTEVSAVELGSVSRNDQMEAPPWGIQVILR